MTRDSFLRGDMPLVDEVEGSFPSAPFTFAFPPGMGYESYDIGSGSLPTVMEKGGPVVGGQDTILFPSNAQAFGTRFGPYGSPNTFDLMMPPLYVDPQILGGQDLSGTYEPSPPSGEWGSGSTPSSTASPEPVPPTTVKRRISNAKVPAARKKEEGPATINLAANTNGAVGVQAVEDDGTQTLCSNCSTTNTPLWRRDPEGNPLCESGVYGGDGVLILIGMDR